MSEYSELQIGYMTGGKTDETLFWHMREIWFYVMSGGVMLKIVVMENARIIQMF